MAGQWIEADTVAIRRALRLVDDAARGKPGSHAALTALEDRLGLTPKRGAICDGSAAGHVAGAGRRVGAARRRSALGVVRRQRSLFAFVTREEDRFRAKHVPGGLVGIGLPSGRLTMVMQFLLALQRMVGHAALSDPMKPPRDD